MVREVEKIYYFIRRDIFVFSTYKTNLVLMILTTIFGALTYAFLGNNANMQTVLQTYNMPLKTYLLIGIAFSTYLLQALTQIQKTINPWSLEEVLVTPTKLSTFIIGSSVWGFIWSTIAVFTYIGVGIIAFQVILNINLVATILVLALGIGTFFGFGMIGAALLIVIKQGDPVAWLITAVTGLFGNVFFPPQVMPSYLQAIAYLTPQYYFFKFIRLTMTGWPIQSIFPEVLILIGMCTITLALGYLLFSACLRKTKRDGTLSWF